VQAHANDLRVEGDQQWETVAAGELPEPERRDAFVHQVVDDWRAAGLNAAMRALCEYAERLTVRPAGCRQADVAALRDAGWCDRSIHDAVQVVAYFNYINRVADGLGVAPEPGLPHWGG